MSHHHEVPRPSSSTRSIAQWHRTLCWATPWLAVSGDLSPRRNEAIAQLQAWVEAGVTDIVDCRGEYSDEDLVASLAPQLRYHYIGTHDDGTAQSTTWFDEGLAALATARSHENAKVLVHCHMGVNRGPSMALAYLLDQGWDLVAALNAIRDARPIAVMAYAHDVIVDHHVRQGTEEDLPADLVRLDQWLSTNNIDMRTIIHQIRQSE